MSIKAVIFDFGGVLLRTEDPSYRKKWEKALSLTEGDLSTAIFNSDAASKASLGEIPEMAIWENVQTQFNLSESDIEVLKTDFWRGDYLDLDLVNYLKTLRPKFKSAILSNAWTGARTLFTESYFLNTVVDLIIISSEEKLVKPDIRIYKLAAERLKVQPDECVFVDDFIENILGARAAGMTGILFLNSAQVVEDINHMIKY